MVKRSAWLSLRARGWWGRSLAIPAIRRGLERAKDWIMAESEGADLDEGPPRRVDVELFIVHPTMSPGEISAALRLEAHVAHGVDELRKTLRETSLPGRYQETRWRHCIRYDLTSQWFAAKITALVNCLAPHKAFLHRVRASGGTAQIIVQFLGDGYLADSVPLPTLAKMVDLQLDFGIECFTVQQL
jgi:hypothetical protein